MAPTVASDYDVLIAGAGAAGAACALHLARAGLRVALVDRRARGALGRPWVNGVADADFVAAGLEPPAPPVRFGTDGAAVLASPLGARVRVARSPLGPVDMRRLAPALVELAEIAGARVLCETPVRDVVTRDGAVAGLELGGATAGRVIARAVVDATGLGAAVRCRVPAELWPAGHDEGLEDGRLLRADLCVAHMEVRRLADPAAARAWLDTSGIAPGDALSVTGVAGGYSIVNVRVDLAAGTLSLLTGAKADRGAGSAVDLAERFVAEHRFAGERVFGGGAAIPIRRAFDDVTAPGLALLGDAAAQVFPAHGSGVGVGLIAARALAETLAAALAGGGAATRAALWRYNVATQRCRGADCAAFDVMRRLSETLSPGDTEALIGSGLLGPDEAAAGLAATLAAPGLRRAARLVAPRTLIAWRLAPRLARAGVAAAAVRALYRRYPATPDRAELARWAKAVRRWFR